MLNENHKRKEKYNGTLKIDFITDNPDKFMSELRENFMEYIENDELKLTEHEYVPEKYRVRTQLGRTITEPPSLFNDNMFEVMTTITNLESDLETICMYGTQKELNKYLNELKEIIGHTNKLRKQITEEDIVHEMKYD